MDPDTSMIDTARSTLPTDRSRLDTDRSVNEPTHTSPEIDHSALETDRSISDMSGLTTDRTERGLVMERSFDESNEFMGPSVVARRAGHNRMGSLNSDLTPAEWENENNDYGQGRIVVDGNDLDLDMLREPAPVKQLTAKFETESFDDNDSEEVAEDESIELDEYLASDRDLSMDDVDISMDEEPVPKAPPSSYTVCTFVRKRGGVRMTSTFFMYSDEIGKVNARRLLMVAKKESMFKGYHLYDMAGTAVSSIAQCHPQSANFKGEILHTQSNPLRLILRKDTHEYIAVQYEKQTVLNYAQHGLKLREILVAMPGVDAFGRHNLHNTAESGSLTEYLGEREIRGSNEVVALKTMLPVYHKGSYRLHFLDRNQEKKVPIIPSGKNLQLIAYEAVPHADKPQIAKSQVELEFVKTGKDMYRIHFREPLCLEQAFVIAMAQFSSV